MALNSILHHKRDTWLQQLLQSPCKTLAKTVYKLRHRLLAAAEEEDLAFPPTSTLEGEYEPTRPISIVCISDTHNTQPLLPDGDILIHAGDLSTNGTGEELQAPLDWLNSQPHRHKVVVAGNHDIVLDSAKVQEFGWDPRGKEGLRWGSVRYLLCQAVLLRVGGREVCVYGDPATRRQGNWAFQFGRGEDVFSHTVIEGVDVLVTHSPPRGYLDDDGIGGGGDEGLLREVRRVMPRLHVFGHVHEGYGREVVVWDEFEGLYEEVCEGGSWGWWGVVRMVGLLVGMWVFGEGGGARRTVMVNAAVVGGRRNEERRGVQVVWL